MRGRSLSLLAGMGLVGLVALGAAAVRVASGWWLGVMIVATLVVLCGSLVGAVQARGSWRRVWQGMALFGWPFLVVTNSPEIGGSIAEAVSYGTAVAAMAVERQIGGPAAPGVNEVPETIGVEEDPMLSGATESMTVVTSPTGSPSLFRMMIVRMLFVLAFAGLGGMMGLLLGRSRDGEAA